MAVKKFWSNCAMVVRIDLSSENDRELSKLAQISISGIVFGLREKESALCASLFVPDCAPPAALTVNCVNIRNRMQVLS